MGQTQAKFTVEPRGGVSFEETKFSHGIGTETQIPAVFGRTPLERKGRAAPVTAERPHIGFRGLLTISSKDTFYTRTAIKPIRVLFTLYILGKSDLANAARSASEEDESQMTGISTAYAAPVVWQEWTLTPYAELYAPVYLEFNYALHGTTASFAEAICKLSPEQQKFWRGLAYSTMCATIDNLIRLGLIEPGDTMGLMASGTRRGRASCEPEKAAEAGKLRAMYTKWGLKNTEEAASHFEGTVEQVRKLCQSQSTHTFEPGSLDIVDTRSDAEKRAWLTATQWQARQEAAEEVKRAPTPEVKRTPTPEAGLGLEPAPERKWATPRERITRTMTKGNQSLTVSFIPGDPESFRLAQWPSMWTYTLNEVQHKASHDHDPAYREMMRELVRAYEYETRQPAPSPASGVESTHVSRVKPTAVEGQQGEGMLVMSYSFVPGSGEIKFTDGRIRTIRQLQQEASDLYNAPFTVESIYEANMRRRRVIERIIGDYGRQSASLSTHHALPVPRHRRKR